MPIGLAPAAGWDAPQPQGAGGKSEPEGRNISCGDRETESSDIGHGSECIPERASCKNSSRLAMKA